MCPASGTHLAPPCSTRFVVSCEVSNDEHVAVTDATIVPHTFRLDNTSEFQCVFESVGHACSCEAKRVFCGMLGLAVSEVTKPGVIVSLLILCRAISEHVIHQGLLLLWAYSPCYRKVRAQTSNMTSFLRVTFQVQYA